MRSITTSPLILLISLLLVSPFASGDEPIKAYLDVAGFSFATNHHPVTRDDILSQKSEIWTISSRTDKERLRKILNTGTKQEFDRTNLRIIIFDGKDEYHIDDRGVVERNWGDGVRINRDELIAFQQALDKSQREVKPLEFQ